jgi:hypothetical protein
MLQNLLIDQAKATASTILGSIRALTLQLESVITGTKAEEEPMYSALGVIARPKSPVTTASGVALKGECEVLAVKNDDGMQPFAYKDLRIHARCPSPAEGDIFLAGYQGGYVSIRAATGTLGDVVKMYAPRIDSSGTFVLAHHITLDPHGSASPAIAIHHGSGYSIRITNAGDIEARANTLVVNPDASPQNVVLWDNLNTWINQVNAAFAVISAAAGLNPNPSITVPTAAPISSSKLRAAP